MYARSTTVHADPQRIDEGIAYVRDEVMPAVQSMPGCMGLSMLGDRDSGRCIVTTSWDSEESMSASREAVRAMRERAVDVMGGQFDVQEWEIAVLHRAHRAPEGACCRVTWTRGDPARMDDMAETFRTGLVPRLDEIEGFCSVSVMGDRQTGMSVLTATYDDRGSLDRSAEAVRGMREQFTQQMGLEITDMAEFELVIHHLRVPEMV
ncbi:antibiotic biosynthesis monooxygenase [Blastococcus mobilis]|uniref:Antibiotic biosynthesis monooxygenase n=1 Tax=Blastococcus mobilis TaxID=1938746 RepID=A0A238XC62_9ACTN|nr:antibiotic biosynthesis monooxygenase [Blastococcus mobilis]SNR56192.1 Antibiotic biosynthesis monooxygenase [Blastococcus mobilis]